jgi:hypothetical protein
MVEPAHPSDSDRDRWLIEKILPFGVAVVAVFVAVTTLLGAPL